MTILISIVAGIAAMVLYHLGQTNGRIREAQKICDILKEAAEIMPHSRSVAMVIQQRYEQGEW